jgi:hypothetical protein
LAHSGQDEFAKSLLNSYRSYRTEQTQSVLEKHILRKYPEGSGDSIFSPSTEDSGIQPPPIANSSITTSRASEPMNEEAVQQPIEEHQPVYASGSHLTGVNLPPVPKRPVDNTQSAGFHA